MSLELHTRAGYIIAMSTDIETPLAKVVAEIRIDSKEKKLKIVPVSMYKVGSDDCKICGAEDTDDNKLRVAMTSYLITTPPVGVVCCGNNLHCQESAKASVQHMYADLGAFLYETRPEGSFNIKRTSGAIQAGWHINYVRKSKNMINTYCFDMWGPDNMTKASPLKDFIEANPDIPIMTLMPKLSEYYPKKEREDMEAAFAAHVEKKE